MTRQPSRRRRRRAAVIAVAPIAAIVVAFGALSAAWAYNGSTQSGCNTGHVCYYADANRAPNGSAHQVLNIGGDVRDWTNIPDDANPPVCGGLITFTWNDCASSIWARGTTQTEYVWTDAFCLGTRKPIAPGDIFNTLSSTFNNAISSDRDGNNGSNC